MTVNYFMVVKLGQDPSGAVSGGWGAANISGKVGSPSDVDGYQFLWQNPPSAHVPSKCTMPWPGGVCRCVYRVARDPYVVGDDSGDPYQVQAYNHGWVIAERLNMMLEDLYENSPQWPLPGNYSVLMVTGSPAASDAHGWYGMTSLTPGLNVTARQLLEGDNAGTPASQIANICDLLAAKNTETNKDSVRSAFTTTASLMWAGQAALLTALYAASVQTQAAFWGRLGLAWRCVLAALGETPSSVGGVGVTQLNLSMQLAMQAILGKEAGLIGATFTSTHYRNMTDRSTRSLPCPAATDGASSAPRVLPKSSRY